MFKLISYLRAVTRLYFIPLLLYLSTIQVHGQDQQIIDSLKSVIDAKKQLPDGPAGDTSVCNAYISWGEQVYFDRPDTAVILWQIAQDIAKQNLTSKLPHALEKTFLYSSAVALNNMGIIYDSQGDIQQALDYSFKSLETRKKLGDQELIATSLNNIGSIYSDQGEIQKALKYYKESLNIYETIGDQTGIAAASNNIGVIYKNQGDIPKALEYYHKSLVIGEELGDKNGVAGSLNNIGYIYYNQGDIKKALEYVEKALTIYKNIGNKNGMAVSLNSIGAIYKTNGDLIKALEYFNKALKLYEEVRDKNGVAGCFHNIGYLYKRQRDFSKALEYYHKSLILYEEIGNKAGIASDLYNIGLIELDQASDEPTLDKQGKLAQALISGKRGLLIAREMGSPDLISSNSELLSMVAKKQGNYEDALEMHELHIQMRDSIKNEETQKATIRQQTKYEFEKAQLVKEQKVREAGRLVQEIMKRRDNLQYSVILISLLVLFGGVRSLGFIKVSPRMAEGIIFFSFLILFEFLLVLADPYIDGWSGGAPGIKLLFNAGIAALIFPMHAFFESRLKGKLVKST